MLMALKSLAAVQTKPIIKTAKQITQFLNYSATRPGAVTEWRRSGTILHIYLDASYISEPEAQSRAGGYIFLRTKIKHTDTRNTPRKRTSAFIMKYHEKCHCISHGSRIGGIIWRLTESDIHENVPSRNRPPTTTNTGGKGQYSVKQHRKWNGKNKTYPEQ